MSFKRGFFKSISTFALYNYLSQGFEFLATIILSRLLLPEEYGFVAIINIFAGFIQLFSNVGIGQSVIRSDYRYTFHRHLYSLSVWMGVLLMLILSGLSFPIAYFFNNPALVVPTILISFKFVFDSFTYIPYALLSKDLQFKYIGRSKLWGATFQIILTIILALLGFSYWSLIIPLVLGPIVQFLYLRDKVDIRFRLFGWKSAKMTLYKIRSLMGSLSLNNMINYWSGNADKVVIGRLYTQADLGLYNRAFRFIMLTNRLITGIFNTVLFPSLKKLIDDKGDANREYLDILRIITIFNLPVVFVLAVFPYELVRVLWGINWTGVSEFLPYVGMILVFNSIISTTPSVFILYGKERNMFLINLVNSILTVAFVIVGGLFSMMHIIIFLSLGYIFITVPINIYFGFYRSFSASWRLISGFWMPVMLFAILLFLSVYFNWVGIKLAAFAAYTSYLLYELRSSVHGALVFIYERVTPGRGKDDS